MNKLTDSVDQLNTSPPPADEISQRHPLIRAAELGVVGYEVTPFDDALRYAILGATYAATRSPEFSAMAYGASTLFTEGIAATAAADLLASGRGKGFVSWANSKLEGWKVTSAVKTNKAAKAAIATYFGSPILLTIKQREEPSRSLRQNLRYGWGTAATLSGVCAVEGLGLTEVGDTFLSKVVNGVENNAKPEIAVPAVLALGGIIAARKWVKGKLQSSNASEEEL